MTEQATALVRSLGTIAVLHRGIETSPDRMSDADLVRATSFGCVHTLMVDIDSMVASTVYETTGAVSCRPEGMVGDYGVRDEIAGLALRTGARVLAVREKEIPSGKLIAAILRCSV
ncbi:hypothetical protein [Dinoroseobacter shibae]|uniref:hypothetical protein n=1 Tax=Dinoroseobacter shibae TaxID=215813 RepID=UPI0030EEFFB9